MTQLAKIETKTVRLNRQEVMERKNRLEEIWQKKQMIRQMVMAAFLCAFIGALSIDDQGAKLSLAGMILLIAFGYNSYLPQEMIELKKELEDATRQEQLFLERDKRQAEESKPHN